MRLPSLQSWLAAVALFATAVVGTAQTKPDQGRAADQKSAAANTAKEKAKEGAANTAKEKAKEAASNVADLQKQVEARRDAMIAEHEALQKQLKDATEQEKKAIREKMEEQKRAFEEATRALGKKMADERRKQRAGAAPKR